jgi:allophanate hydrolase subunit 2
VAGDRPSFGVVPGAIQLTPSGQPIVLMPDGGVTGGYAVIAVALSADLPVLGQLVPGASLRFRITERHPNVTI